MLFKATINKVLTFYILSFLNDYSFGSVHGGSLSEAPRPICIYYDGDSVTSENTEDTDDDIQADGKTVRCGSPDDYCFSFWKINNTILEGTANVSSDMPDFSWLLRGCFKNVDMCNLKDCVATEREASFNYFCCCKGDRCNEQISFNEIILPTPEVETENSDVHNDEYLNYSLYLAGILFLLVITFLLLAFFTKYLKWRQNKKNISDTPVNFDKSPTSPCIDLNNLEFLEELGRGRYGTVKRALLGDEDVAVKLFLSHHKSSFVNEKYIYSLPLMEHSNLLSFLGGGEILGPDKNPYLGLVLSYCPEGKLSSLLQHKTLDWATFCRIVISTVKGLGHLHSNIRKGDLIKPSVAHRDFNTRNILLKADMSCVVSDLGFAIHTQGAKFYVNGEEQLAEMASLTDVGTLRYMAPEVLEGAVNLRDCETSLKQIDIYALGLVLWEIASRCHDLYQGTPAPAYALPFQAEIGLHPSYEQMQILVARNKARPLFPLIWKDSNPAIRQLKETIVDCWDNDAEARLSAMCVEKRLMELTQLLERYRNSLGINGVSPTTNPSAGGLMAKVGTDGDTSFIISNELCLPKDRYLRESSVSENTYETTIPFSPSDNQSRLFGKNHFVDSVPVNPPVMLQPHQGRNPCMERNTISENSYDNNRAVFIEASDKFHYASGQYGGLTNVNIAEILEVQHGLDSNMLMNEQLMPLLNSILPASHQPLIPTEAPPPPQVSLPPVLPPIPYLQNEIDNTKRSNLPKESPTGWKKWKAAWEGKLGALLPRRRNRAEDEEHQNILHTPTSSGFSEPLTPLAPFQASVEVPPPNPHQTQVYINRGAPQTVLSKELNIRVQAPLNKASVHAETDIGIAMLGHQRGLAPISRSSQDSKDSGINKSSDNSSSFIDTDSSSDHVRRPTTLLLQRREKRFLSVRGANSDDDFGSDDTASSSSRERVKLRKPKQRIKTPRAPPIEPRLSLYDDSVMAGTGVASHTESTLSRSLPLDMNSIGYKTNRFSGDKSSGSSSINKNRQSDSSSSGNSSSESSVNEDLSHHVKASEAERFNPSITTNPASLMVLHV